jgi:hypothetical protein
MKGIEKITSQKTRLLESSDDENSILLGHGDVVYRSRRFGLDVASNFTAVQHSTTLQMERKLPRNVSSYTQIVTSSYFIRP